MNTSNRFANVLAQALRTHEFGTAGAATPASAARDGDLGIEAALRAIRVAGLDRQAAISAGHRVLVRSVVAR